MLGCLRKCLSGSTRMVHVEKTEEDAGISTIDAYMGISLKLLC